MTKNKPGIAPLQTKPAEQKDDNIDALGRKAGGSKMEQPAGTEALKPQK